MQARRDGETSRHAMACGGSGASKWLKLRANITSSDR